MTAAVRALALTQTKVSGETTDSPLDTPNEEVIRGLAEGIYQGLYYSKVGWTDDVHFRPEVDPYPY